MDKLTEEQMAVIPKPEDNKVADVVGVIGFGTTVCEVIRDPKNQVACRDLLLPLENGRKDPIETLVDLLIANPEEIDEATNRFNYNMQQAIEIAEKRIQLKNDTGKD